jgi:hypothetical protein
MITPPIGMGSNFERTVANGNPIVLRGWHQGVGVDHIIEITEETDSTPSTISIPAACDHFDIVYFSRGGFIQRSYWVDINGVYHPFSAENTPVSALSTPEEPTGIVTIEGQQVIKSNIKIIVFGNDYLSTTAIPRNFMRHFNNLTHMGISGLSNVVTAAGDIFVYLLSIIDPDISALSKLSVINNHFFSNSRLKIIDFLAPLSNVVTINSYFFAYNNTLEKADISPLVKVRSFGTGLFRDCRSLKEIQIGGLDFSVITGDGLNTVSNTPEGILRANSQALADAFKARFPNVSNWTVIINEAA